VSAPPLARALPLYLAAGACLSTLDATAKWLVQDHALLLVVWARYAGQMLVVTPFALHRAGPAFWRTRRLPLHLVRSTLLLLATVCFFGGLRHLPLGEGAAITYLAPILVVLLSRAMLGEVPRVAHVVGAVAGFVGVLVIVRPGAGLFHPAALLLVATAACNALYAILTRRLREESAYTSLFYSALVGTLAMTLALPWIGATLPARATDAGLFLLLGLAAGIGHFLLILAFTRAPAASLMPFTYLQLVWATLYGWLVFGHLPDGISLAGMAVIVAGGLALALQERRPEIGA
jgi:drug/metabolite transporter (DMT)-like permease